MSTRAFSASDDARQRLAENRLYRFHGGLRLRHNKKVSCELPVAPVPLLAFLGVIQLEAFLGISK